MRLKRVVSIAIAIVMTLLSSPAGAQDPTTTTVPNTAGGPATSQPPFEAPTFETFEVPTFEVPTFPGPTEPSTPEAPNPEVAVAIPPPVDAEIAAVLENERRAVAVEEARAVAAVEQAAADAMVGAAQGVVDQAALQVADAVAVVADAQSKLDAILADVERAGTEASAKRSRVAEIGVEMYTATGSERDPRTAVAVAVLANKDIPDASAVKAYRDTVSSAAFGDLQDAKQTVARIMKTVAAAEDVVHQAGVGLSAATEVARAAEAELAIAQKQAETIRSGGDKRVEAAAAEAPSLKSTELSGGLEILGDPLVSAADLAAFVRQRGRPHPSVDLEALASIFIAEGRAEGVRADVAWIQSIIETGWFSFAGSMVHVDDYNYAGIGACDSCSRGIIFKNMEDGVRTQIQLLRTYATKGLRTADLANPPPRLAPERSFVRGCCGTWMKLSGVWATGPGYGIKILTGYNQLLSLAAARRSL